jgi:hypothetical protein
VTLPPGDAVSAEIPPEWPGARVAALTLTDVLVSNFIVNAEIRDTNTNQIIAILIGLLAPPTRRGTPALFDLQDPVD